MKRIVWIVVFIFAVSGCWAEVTMTPSGSWEISGTCLTHGDSYLHSTLSLGMEFSFTDNVTAHISTLSRYGMDHSSFELRESYLQLGTIKAKSDKVSSPKFTLVDDWETDRRIGQQYYLVLETSPAKYTSIPITMMQPDNYVSELVFSEFNYQPPTRYLLFENA